MNNPETIFIPGPVGQLEALVTEPEVLESHPIVGIICHPNPTQEGSMRNKVVTTIARAFEMLGLVTVRFNYRGVGQSDGEYGHVVGEIDDLASVIRWVKARWEGCRLWLGGFSFGSFVAASVANQNPEIEQLLTVAPANDRQNFAQLDQVACPWLVIVSDADEIVCFDQVKPWLDHPSVPMDVKIMSGASHFFHGRLIELRQLIVDHYA